MLSIFWTRNSRRSLSRAVLPFSADLQPLIFSPSFSKPTMITFIPLRFRLILTIGIDRDYLRRSKTMPSLAVRCGQTPRATLGSLHRRPGFNIHNTDSRKRSIKVQYLQHPLFVHGSGPVPRLVHNVRHIPGPTQKARVSNSVCTNHGRSFVQ